MLTRLFCLVLSIAAALVSGYASGAGDTACAFKAPAYMAVSAGSAMCTNRPTSNKWSMTLPATYSPGGTLTLRFTGTADWTGLLVVVEKGAFEFAALPSFVRPGLCAPMASVTHSDASAKSPSFSLTWTAPPVGSGPVRFVAMVFGSRSGRTCDYYGADVVLTEGAATPRPPTPPPVPTPPPKTTTVPVTPAPTPEVLTGQVTLIKRGTGSARLLQRDPGDEWDRIAYDDFFWRPTRMPFGFGYTGSVSLTGGTTLIAPISDAFARIKFPLSATQLAAVKFVLIKIAVDDSADVVVNEKVMATDASLDKAYSPSVDNYFTEIITVPKSSLVADDNLVAVHVINLKSPTTMLFDVEVVLSFTDAPVGATSNGGSPAPTVAGQSSASTGGSSGKSAAATTTRSQAADATPTADTTASAAAAASGAAALAAGAVFWIAATHE